MLGLSSFSFLLSLFTRWMASHKITYRQTSLVVFYLLQARSYASLSFRLIQTTEICQQACFPQFFYGGRASAASSSWAKRYHQTVSNVHANLRSPSGKATIVRACPDFVVFSISPLNYCLWRGSPAITDIPISFLVRVPIPARLRCRKPCHNFGNKRHPHLYRSPRRH